MQTDEHIEEGAIAESPRAARPAERPGERPEGQEATEDTVWIITQAAAYLQVSVNAVYKMTSRKATVRIPHVRIGGRLRFRRSDLDRWLHLLTVSNLDVLEKVRRAFTKETHGNHPRAQAP